MLRRVADLFMDAVKQVVAANKDYIPPEGKVRLAPHCCCCRSRPDARSPTAAAGLAVHPASADRFGPHPGTCARARVHLCHLCFPCGLLLQGAHRCRNEHLARVAALDVANQHVPPCRAQGGQLTPIDLIVETEYHRAAPGGTGGTKCVGNYSPVLKTQLAAKAVGFSDVVYLDAKENKYIEEVSSCNIFVVKGKRISTPALRCV